MAGRRRGIVRRLGKRLLRGVREFQGRHSLVGQTAVVANDRFPWAARLAWEYPAIRRELDALLASGEVIPAFHVVSPDQARISTGDHWKTFVFYVYGHRVHENCLRCPRTAALLDGLPRLQNAWFSILEAGYHVPAHRGPTRAVVRAHLGLRVPAQRERCWLRVDGEICHWAQGEVLIFDDTFEHEVYNATAEPRVVLFVDIDRPMDTIGTLLNAVLVRLMRLSDYVQGPLANLAHLAHRRRERSGA